MKILAIETATGLGGVALIEDETLLAEYRMDMAMAHAERLMVMVDRVLHDCELIFGDLNALAVSIGPGSFTGLRVAISTVKGLLADAPMPVAAVPTLEALAGNVSDPGRLICPMMDAKKQEVYAALFTGQPDGSLKRLVEDQVVSPPALAEQLKRHFTEPTVFVGDGARRYREVLEQALAGRARFAPGPLDYPLPSMVARCGLERLKRGEAADVRTLVPLYIRRPDAELNWERGVRPKSLNLKRKQSGAGRR